MGEVGDADVEEVDARKQFDLFPGHEVAQLIQVIGPPGAEPVEEGTGVVDRQPDARMAGQGVEHRLVRLLGSLGEDVSEVSDWLVVMDDEAERQGRHRLAVIC